MFYLIIYKSAHHHRHHLGTLGGGSGIDEPPPPARAPLQDVSRATPPPATDDGQQLGTLGGVLGDDLSQPDTLGTHPGGPAAYLQQFRGEGGGGAHPVRRRSSASVGLFFRGGYSEYQIFTSDFGRHATTAPLKSVVIFNTDCTSSLGCAK